MSAQRDEILSRLDEYGWKGTRLGDHELEWWADEIWLLESTWSPVGKRAFLTFLVDPRAGRERARGEDVWAVGASARKPLDRLGMEFVLSLNTGWKERLPQLFEFLSAMRDTA